jgi:hypothetical protein
MSTYNYTPGLGSAASYQVSGKPWLSASISPIDGVIELKFPAVTSWVSVRNMGGEMAVVGFSKAGILSEQNGWPLDAISGTFGPVDLKVTRLYISGSRADQFSLHVAAGLTSIPVEQLDYASGSVVQLGGRGIQGPNWSGSAGVG